MGCDYALVHLIFTIPPAVVLSAIYFPFFTRLDIYKISFLVLIAVVATTPWDSYLIRTRIWTYPPDAVLGPTLFQIPLEELFFFVIQTYTTSLIYIILNKPTLHATYLLGRKTKSKVEALKWMGITLAAILLIIGINLVQERGQGLYMGLILVWSMPFVLLLYSLGHQLVLGMPWTNVALPIALPTLYLWIVDTLSLQRGTWAIESGTKLGWNLWPSLEIEEAVFFLVTNLMIVLGQVAFDGALAILQAFPSTFPTTPDLPSPLLLVQALLLSTSEYDESRIQGFREAIDRLRNKSRSFYLASGIFGGRLRIDLVLLYSFCRVADDLVDEAQNKDEAQKWIANLKQYLDISYSTHPSEKNVALEAFIKTTFPPATRSALGLLPTTYLSSQPLYDLLKGFETDLEFNSHKNQFPITDEEALRLYGSRVAGTVAELCIELVYHHSKSGSDASEREDIISAGGRMGIALQYVNIARDVGVDTAIGRIYIPTTWLDAAGIGPHHILLAPKCEEVEMLRQRLLDKADELYEGAKAAIEQLPLGARGPMRVAVESYMEIGRVLRTRGYTIKKKRATVPKMRRLTVAWKALRG